ncbi:MAG: hypothetical protein Q9195_003970, partial [Heterodermia aff. obscurata]
MSVEYAQKLWDDHSANPFNWPEQQKWRVILTAGLVTLLVGLNATTPSQDVADTFHIDDSGFPNSFWPTTVWNTGAAIGPLIGLPLLENFGVRNGYLLSYFVFTVMIVPQAVAQNFATLLVTRTIAGFFAGIVQNAMETLIADMWFTDDKRNLPITLFTFLYIAGVTLGPTLDTIVKFLSWRWVFYIQLIIYCAVMPLLLLAIKETRGPIVLSKSAKHDTRLKKAVQSHRPSISGLMSEAITRPVHLLCTEPVIFFFTLWASFCFGLVFISTQSVPQVYSTVYNFGDTAAGLLQLALLAGATVGFFASLPQNTYYQRSATRNPIEVGQPIPEARLPLSIPASLIGLAGGLFCYGWGSFPHVPWIVPTIGLGLMGFAIMVVINTVDLYITDAYTKYAGSAIAAVALGENLFAAWLPLAAPAMYTTLGFQWASSLLGFVALGLTLAPIFLYFKGRAVREK